MTPAVRAILLSTPYCVEARAYFNRIPVPPPVWKKTADNALIAGLVADGVWSHLDAIYSFAAGDLATACVNMVSSSYTLTVTLSPTLTAYVGVAGTSANYLAGPNPSTAGTKLVRNTAMIGGSSEDPDAPANPGPMITNGDNSIKISQKLSPPPAVETTVGLTSAEKDLGDVSPDATGIFIANRTGAAGFDVLRNDTSLGAQTAASVAVNNSILKFCTGAANVSIAFFGEGLTGPQLTALYTRVEAWRDALGLNNVIIAPGDSITATAVSYLNLYPDVSPRRVRIINLAVPGAGMADWESAAPALLRNVPVGALGAKTVTLLLMAGTNNLAGTDPAVFATEVSDLMAVYKAKNSALITALILCLPQGSGVFNTARDTYNGIISGAGWIAANNVGYLVAVAGNIMWVNTTPANTTYFDVDGVHPTATGQLTIRTAVAVTLDALNPP